MQLGEVRSQLSNFFTSDDIFEQSVKGNIFSYEVLAKRLKRPISSIISALENPILVKYKPGVRYKQRVQYLVDLGKGYCGLDTEGVVKNCFESYLKSNEYKVLKNNDLEVALTSSNIKQLAKQSGINSIDELEWILNGIDVVCTKESKVFIYELKGRMSFNFRTRDFYELLFQLAHRIILVFETVRDEFSRFSFGITLPGFESKYGSNIWYILELKILSGIFQTGDNEAILRKIPYEKSFYASNNCPSKVDNLKCLATDLNLKKMMDSKRFSVLLVNGLERVEDHLRHVPFA